MKKVHLCIARYNENVNYLVKYINVEHITVYLYNKGNYNTIPDALKSASNIHIKNVDNVGRESYSYLLYCIENYDLLMDPARRPDNVLFAQGHPFDHMNPTQVDKCVNMSEHYVYDYLGQFTKNTNPGYGLYNMRLTEWKGPLEMCDEPFDKWFMHNVCEEVDPNTTDLMIRYGATFLMSINKIASRPKKYYENLIRFLLTLNPEAGHFFERSWYYIFNCHNNNV
jgi:hypothetical protein